MVIIPQRGRRVKPLDTSIHPLTPHYKHKIYVLKLIFFLIILTGHLQIEAYRLHAEMQDAVDRLLKIEKEEP